MRNENPGSMYYYSGLFNIYSIVQYKINDLYESHCSLILWSGQGWLWL